MAEKRESFAAMVLDYICLAFVRAVIGAMYLLPDAAGLAIARTCIGALRICMPRLGAVGMRNLELVFPEKSPDERKQILRESFDTLARNLQTYSKIPNLTRERAAEMIDYADGKKLIDSVRAAHPGIGVILPTLHFGSFELLVQLQALNDRPIAFLARGVGLQRVDRWWNIRREMFGNHVFGRRGGYQEMVTRLRDGQEVALLFDQNVKSSHACFVDLFGIKAATTRAIALASIRTGAPIVFATCIDYRNGRYELICRSIPSFEELETEERIHRISRALNERLEEVVRRCPEQWFWIHRRFKTRPQGEPENIYQGI
ncbi:MAG: hypothetical protein U0136_20315 [Bdellovibrionota bacterium]